MNKRNTFQKEMIAQIVEMSCDHPTAETIYLRAKAQLPTISLGTVYRVLKELVRCGRVVELTFASAPSRYDKTLRAHAHLYCKQCGKVLDVDYDHNQFMLDISKNGGKIIDDVQITLTGLCDECAKSSKC